MSIYVNKKFKIRRARADHKCCSLSCDHLSMVEGERPYCHLFIVEYAGMTKLDRKGKTILRCDECLEGEVKP
jgi:hypothetical protein